MNILIAERKHKQIVVELVTDAFAKDPQIVTYTNGKRSKIKLIASLAFEICIKSNSIFLTKDLKAVAVCHPSIHKDVGARIFWENFKFPFVFGINSLNKMLKIEKEIIDKRRLPKNGLYLWLLATDPAYKGKGHGSLLLNYLTKLNSFEEIILETSNIQNVAFYEKRAFTKYDFIKIKNQLPIYFFTSNSKH